MVTIKKVPDPVDKYVGGRMRMRRIMLSLSQEKLADALGITFQQVQKYETGANRISASRLHRMAAVLQVPVSFFFEGAPSHADQGAGPDDDSSPAYVSQFLATADGLALTKAFMRIDGRKARRAIVNLVEAIADDGVA